MRIGELARSAGVNIQTIRFYEREHLLPRPERTDSGYRLYYRRDLERVTFIKRNQELGFTLAEIRQVIDLHNALASISFPIEGRPDALRQLTALGEQRLEAIEDKIKTLETMRRELASTLKNLDAASLKRCPVANKPRRPAGTETPKTSS